MSAKDVAEQVGLLCTGCIGLIAGVPGSGAAVAVSVATLVAIGRDVARRCSDRNHRTARDAALRALRDSPDFTEDHLDRAAALLASPSHPAQLYPGDLHAAATSGAETFDRDLAHRLVAGIPFEPDDAAPREAILLALESGLAACRRDPDHRDGLTQTLVMEIARTQYVQIEIAERIDRTTQRTEVKVDDLGAGMAEVLSLLLRQEVVERATTAGVDEAVVVKIARAYEPSTEDNVDSALRQIEAAVEEAIALRRRLGTVSNHGEFADLVLNRMRELAAQGAFEKAAEEASSAWAAEEEAEAEEHRARVQRRAALAAEAVSIARLSNEPQAAARWLLVETETNSLGDLFPSIEAATVEWQERGRARGLAFDLAVAAELAGLAADRAPGPVEQSEILLRRGFALQDLAWRSGRPSLLQDAIGAIEAASRVAWKARTEGSWLAAMMALTVAYHDAARMAGETEGLKRCITCLAALVTMATRHEDLRVGALINLATMRTELRSLSMPIDGARNQAEKAVTEYREALEWLQRAGDHTRSALVQHNVGRTLMDLDRLEEALDAFAAALEGRPRDEEPMRWAMTRHNLAGALLKLAVRDRSLAHAQDALEQSGEALEERRQDRVPVEWALTTLLVGEIHRWRWTLTADPIERRRAEAAYTSARAVFAGAGETANARKAGEALAALRP